MKQPKVSAAKVYKLAIEVEVTSKDIEAGICRDANKCAIKVAIERKLRLMNPDVPNHHTRVDGGSIKFNLNDYHWLAHTPAIAKHNLIKFDKLFEKQRQAKKKGVTFTPTLDPFSFKVTAIRGGKIRKRTDQERVNELRRGRAASGWKQKRYTLRDRIVGIA
jgi:hypothetical protein